MTVFNWGESPVGKWKLIIESRTKENSMRNSGKIEYFSLVFYGTRNTNVEVKKRYADQIKAYVPTPEHVKRIYNVELKLSRQTRIVHKRVFETNPELKDVLKSPGEDSDN
jgi:subtilisin-like proprotein convertase family protein